MSEHTFTIEWRTGEIDPARQEAVWFYGYRHMANASLTTDDGKTYALDIYCDGETEYRIPSERDDGTFGVGEYRPIRYADEWDALGIHTDADLNAIYTSWMEREVDIHEANSWFDIYTVIDGVSQHLDAVTHTQTEAQQQARAILEEVASHGGWDAWFASAR